MSENEGKLKKGKKERVCVWTWPVRNLVWNDHRLVGRSPQDSRGRQQDKLFFTPGQKRTENYVTPSRPGNILT
jgi:hypothetical protein